MAPAQSKCPTILLWPSSYAVRVLVPRPVRALALRVALPRCLAPPARLLLFSVGHRNEAVLARVAHVGRLDRHLPRRDGWHGRAGAIVQQNDADPPRRFIEGRLDADLPLRAVLVKPCSRTRWFRRKVTVVASSSAMVGTMWESTIHSMGSTHRHVQSLKHATL